MEIVIINNKMWSGYVFWEVLACDVMGPVTDESYHLSGFRFFPLAFAKSKLWHGIFVEVGTQQPWLDPAFCNSFQNYCAFEM